jgi:hypothetical protein
MEWNEIAYRTCGVGGRGEGIEGAAAEFLAHANMMGGGGCNIKITGESDCERGVKQVLGEERKELLERKKERRQEMEKRLERGRERLAGNMNY